eukprot:scaffold121920_cov27-Tisochrysis_lutea.AAC.3
MLTELNPFAYDSQVMYQLLSVDHNSRIRLKTLCGGHEGDEGIPSSVGVYNAANWLEREVSLPAKGCVSPGGTVSSSRTWRAVCHRRSFITTRPLHRTIR